jgi:hypothetical protein
MMYILSLMPLPGMSGNDSPKPTQLIKFDPRSPRLRFMVTYVPYFTENGGVFKILSRQIGEDGLKINGGAMLDIVANDVLKGKTCDCLASFFKKLIYRECGLWYVYQSSHVVNNDFINIPKWLSWFDGVKCTVCITENSLDSSIGKTLKSPIENSTIPVAAASGARNVPPPPIPYSPLSTGIGANAGKSSHSSAVFGGLIQPQITSNGAKPLSSLPFIPAGIASDGALPFPPLIPNLSSVCGDISSGPSRAFQNDKQSADHTSLKRMRMERPTPAPVFDKIFSVSASSAISTSQPNSGLCASSYGLSLTASVCLPAMMLPPGIPESSQNAGGDLDPTGDLPFIDESFGTETWDNYWSDSAKLSTGLL